MSTDGYEEILIEHWEECEDCQHEKYKKIEDCPGFKKEMAKLEALADYQYELQKEDDLDKN